MLDHSTLASSTLNKILRRSIDQAEVFLVSEKTTKIDVLNQKIESMDEIYEFGMAVRLIKEHKLGFSYTSDLEESVIEDIIDQAIANAASSSEDRSNILPSPSAVTGDLSIFDPMIGKTPVQKKIELALKIEDSAYQTDPRINKTEKISYSDSEAEVWIVNSHGINVSYKTNCCGAHADMIAVQNGEMESGFCISYKKRFKGLLPEEVGKEAAAKAVELLGAKTIPSQKIPLILDPFIGTQILEALSSALSSESVQKGKSLFADKVGKIVGSDILSIIDNGKLPNGLATTPFDGEGIPTQETRLIEAGVLNAFLYNSYTANKGNTGSSGNAIRASFKSLPAVGPTNLYINSGNQSADSIIGSVKKGLYVTRVMGIHTANPISGDFSLGAAGIMIENGEKTYPVRGITIAGNLIDLLKAVEAVGSDLRFFFSLGAPTLRTSALSVSGA